MVKTATFTVGAVAVKEEIKPHRHHDGAHVLYVVSGGGTMTHGDKTITLKPGMIVHVPVGVAHGIKAEGGDLTWWTLPSPPSIRIRWSGSSSGGHHNDIGRHAELHGED